MSENLLEKYDQQNRFGQLLGMEYTVLSPGKIEYRLHVQDVHLATPKAAHGGLISAFVDAALGVAALSAVQQNNQVVSTVEFKVNFLSPAFKEDELCALAEVIQKGNRILIATCDVICKNRNNTLIAKAMGTFNAYNAAKAGY